MNEFSSNFELHLKRAIEDKLKIIATEKANELLVEIHEQMKKEAAKLVAQACLEIFRVMSMRTVGNCLEIRVVMPELKKEGE